MRNRWLVYRKFTGRCLALWTLLTLAGCSSTATTNSDDDPPEHQPSRRHVDAPLTDEECREFGKKMEAAALADDPTAFDELLDWDAIRTTVAKGLNLSRADTANLLEDFPNSIAGDKGLGAEIQKLCSEGGTCTFLRLCERDGKQRALLRYIKPDGGVNYHEVILTRCEDGQVRGTDIFVYLSGEFISETFQRAMNQMLQYQSQLVEKGCGADKTIDHDLDRVNEMMAAFRGGQYQKCVDLYKLLPTELQRQKSVLISRYLAAQKLDKREFAMAVEDFRRYQPSDLTAEFVSIEYYIIKNQHAQALAAIDMLEKAIGGDPYLNIPRARALFDAKDFAAARKAAQKAIDEEPSLKEAYWWMVSISLADKSFDETIRWLTLLEEKFQIEFKDFTAMPVYADFVKSPQYREWMKAREQKRK